MHSTELHKSELKLWNKNYLTYFYAKAVCHSGHGPVWDFDGMIILSKKLQKMCYLETFFSHWTQPVCQIKVIYDKINHVILRCEVPGLSGSQLIPQEYISGIETVTFLYRSSSWKK